MQLNYLTVWSEVIVFITYYLIAYNLFFLILINQKRTNNAIYSKYPRISLVLDFPKEYHEVCVKHASIYILFQMRENKLKLNE